MFRYFSSREMCAFFKRKLAKFIYSTIKWDEFRQNNRRKNYLIQESTSKQYFFLLTRREENLNLVLKIRKDNPEDRWHVFLSSF